MLLVLLNAAMAHPPEADVASDPVVATPGSPLTTHFESVAAQEQVPVELLYAIAYEASGLRLQSEPSAWGGRTMFDLVELDEAGGPSLEAASALISADPNEVVDQWQLAVRAAAALLADTARNQGGGELPPQTDLQAWQSAVAAFSGRHEPRLQQLYVEAVYGFLERGFSAESPLGNVAVQPQRVSVARLVPPPAYDYSGADNYVQACSDNYSDYSRSGSSIDMVVIHTVQGSYSGCASWFANCSAGASAHYVVRSSDGAVTQMVREADVAWHAGNWDYNERSVGIEHEGYVTDCSYYTDSMYRGSAALAADIAARQGVPIDRSHFIGHDEVPDPDGSGWGGSGNHTDPGSCWDWDYYMSLVGGSAGEATGQLIGYVRENDIYNTAGNLAGATVRITETGESTTVDAEGLYRFDDVPYGNYTMTASFSGYGEGSCTGELAGSQKWCSIALSPGSGGEDTGVAEDTGSVDTDLPDDTASTDGPDERPGVAGLVPGKPQDFDALGSTCSTSPLAGALGLVGAFAALARRRR